MDNSSNFVNKKNKKSKVKNSRNNHYNQYNIKNTKIYKRRNAKRANKSKKTKQAKKNQQLQQQLQQQQQQLQRLQVQVQQQSQQQVPTAAMLSPSMFNPNAYHQYLQAQQLMRSKEISTFGAPLHPLQLQAVPLYPRLLVSPQSSLDRFYGQEENRHYKKQEQKEQERLQNAELRATKRGRQLQIGQRQIDDNKFGDSSKQRITNTNYKRYQRSRGRSKHKEDGYDGCPSRSNVSESDYDSDRSRSRDRTKHGDKSTKCKPTTRRSKSV